MIRDGGAGERILFIRLSALGDVVNTLPALEALRRGLPAAHIGFAVEDRARDLIVGHPSVDRVHVLERRAWREMARNPGSWPRLVGAVRSFVRELRAERYTIALDLQGNFKGALHGLASGAARRIGFARGFDKELNHWFTTEQVTPPGATEKLHRVHKFLALVARLGVAVDAPSYRLPDRAPSRARVDAFLAANVNGAFVALHPGVSGRGELKRWPAERFGELAVRIAAELRLAPVVTWGPGEKPLAESVVAASGGAAVLAMQTASVLDLAELISRAALFVGCDSGPLHLASCVGAPSVALFGPKDPRTYGPFHSPNRVVLRGEPGRASMASISVDDAFEALLALARELNVAKETGASNSRSQR